MCVHLTGLSTSKSRDNVLESEKQSLETVFTPSPISNNDIFAFSLFFKVLMKLSYALSTLHIFTDNNAIQR